MLARAVCSLADGVLMVPVVCREVSEGQTMLFCRQNTHCWEQALSGEAKGRAHPSSKGCLYFLPILDC